MNKKRIVCIGDSHASFFSGENAIQLEYPEKSINRIQNLEGIRLGPVLAYSLHKENTTSKGREKLLEIVSKLDKESVAVMFCFGEIDCRFHLLKQAEQKGISIQECIEDCVAKYFGVIKEVAEIGFEILVWNVIPTSNFNSNPEFPHYGTHLQRNQCSKAFNEALKKQCQKAGFLFIDVFDKLVSGKLFTKEYMLFDGIHLGQSGMLYFTSAIKKYYPQVRLPLSTRLHLWMDLGKRYLLYKARKIKNGYKKFL